MDDTLVGDLIGACSSGDLRALEQLIVDYHVTVHTIREKRVFSAFGYACAGGHLGVVERLLSLGLTTDDVRAGNNAALIEACNCDRSAVVCVLVAFQDGVDESTGDRDLLAQVLRQIVRESSALADVVGDEAAQRTKRFLEAVRAASRWPGYEEALAKLARLSPYEAASWDALYFKVLSGGVRFSD